MKTIRLFLSAAIAALFLGLIIPASGSVDLFLKLEGIEGEAADRDYEGWIDVQSFSWGVSRAVSLTGGSAGKAEPKDLVITKYVDKSTPLLALSCAKGELIPTATLAVRKAGDSQVEYYRITMEDVLISSVSVSGSTEEDRPQEVLSLAYAKIRWSYTPTDETGAPGTPIVTGWNFLENVEH